MNQELRDVEFSRLNEIERLDADWLHQFSSQKGILIDDNGVIFKIIYQGDRIISDEEMIFIALTRKTTSDEILFDSDASDSYLEFSKSEVPLILRSAVSKLNLHGEAALAVHVDSNGNPDMKRPLIEQWTIRHHGCRYHSNCK